MHRRAGSLHAGQRWRTSRRPAAGLQVDEFAPSSFFFNAHNDLIEEVAKFRAARRLWARLMRERFGARDPRAWTLRFHAQTAGSMLTAQQPENNIVRVAIQALAAILGGCQSLHTNSMDEALSLPSEAAVRIALRTQQVLAYESGVAATVDPLGGAYLVERLTREIEDAAVAYLDKIDGLGARCRRSRSCSGRSRMRPTATSKRSRRRARVVVGVNEFVTEAPPPAALFQSDPARRLGRRIGSPTSGGGGTGIGRPGPSTPWRRRRAGPTISCPGCSTPCEPTSPWGRSARGSARSSAFTAHRWHSDPVRRTRLALGSRALVGAATAALALLGAASAARGGRAAGPGRDLPEGGRGAGDDLPEGRGPGGGSGGGQRPVDGAGVPSLRPGLELTVFRRGEIFRHPITNQPLGHTEQVLGTLVVATVEGTATGRLVAPPGLAPAPGRRRAGSRPGGFPSLSCRPPASRRPSTARTRRRCCSWRASPRCSTRPDASVGRSPAVLDLVGPGTGVEPVASEVARRLGGSPSSARGSSATGPPGSSRPRGSPARPARRSRPCGPP